MVLPLVSTNVTSPLLCVLQRILGCVVSLDPDVLILATCMVAVTLLPDG